MVEKGGKVIQMLKVWLFQLDEFKTKLTHIIQFY